MDVSARANAEITAAFKGVWSLAFWAGMFVAATVFAVLFGQYLISVAALCAAVFFVGMLRRATIAAIFDLSSRL